MPTPRLKKAARHLLATTCLVAGAEAAAITEGVAPAPTDFGGTLATGYVTPSGTNAVTGRIAISDSFDLFFFTGLTPGSLTFDVSSLLDNAFEYGVEAFDSSGSFLGNLPQNGGASVIVPGDGIVGIRVGADVSEGSANYTVSFEGGFSAVPEPGTTALGALGLAAAAVAAVKRRK
jgi:hypothetical protein